MFEDFTPGDKQVDALDFEDNLDILLAGVQGDYYSSWVLMSLNFLIFDDCFFSGVEDIIIPSINLFDTTVFDSTDDSSL